ncbi:hypothetical protein F4801DRAFT_501367 [Xylaria longipes]|nr:hypothetical protein F4801DRAFT_501367 [Xylaria longipes]
MSLQGVAPRAMHTRSHVILLFTNMHFAVVCLLVYNDIFVTPVEKSNLGTRFGSAHARGVTSPTTVTVDNSKPATMRPCNTGLFNQVSKLYLHAHPYVNILQRLNTPGFARHVSRVHRVYSLPTYLSQHASRGIYGRLFFDTPVCLTNFVSFFPSFFRHTSHHIHCTYEVYGP